MAKPMEAAEYLKRPYTHAIVRDDETGTFTAQLVEFPGCVAQGDTPAEAYERLEQIAREWIAIALEQGDSIPEPFQTHGYSGRIALRLPRTLHKQAAQLAEIEGTSLNQLIVSAISERVGATTLYGKLIDNLERHARPMVVNISVAPNRVATSNQTVHDYQLTPATTAEPRH